MKPIVVIFVLRDSIVVLCFRSLSQNSSVLPEEEDEKSCSESEACRHKLAVDQQEVCVCLCVSVCVCV